LTADSHVSQVKVQTGRRQGERVEILSGIKADAELVNSGAGFLNDGDLVRVLPLEAQNQSQNAEKGQNSVPKTAVAPDSRAQPAIK
jgi:hypothetical protein